MHRIVLIALITAQIASPQSPAPSTTTWKLAWSDEFDGPANTPPDPSKWVREFGHGDDGWGNKELEDYTNAIENAHLDGQGHLIIRALKTPSGEYKSARLKTEGKFVATYGRIEARIKIPGGQGLWPAFWALGADIETAGWPKCGEIDIVENIGKEPDTLHGTLHGPGYSGSKALSGATALGNGAKLSDDYHLYAVDWSKDSIDFLFDGRSYFKLSPASLPAGAKWAFDKPFFLLLNVAVGGNWPGSPDDTTVFPQEMAIDYVRVYQ
jgi:beta-glucanase (GH16 family)